MKDRIDWDKEYAKHDEHATCEDGIGGIGGLLLCSVAVVLAAGFLGRLFAPLNPPHRKPLHSTITAADTFPVLADTSPHTPDFDRAYTLDVKATAYCPCAECCGGWADDLTSQMTDAYTHGIAVNPRIIPYGSKIWLDAFGEVPLIADDTGGAMRNAKELHIDVRFPTHQAALNWGVQYITITIEEPIE